MVVLALGGFDICPLRFDVPGWEGGSMSTKISEELATRLEEAEAQAAMPVIVTLKPGAEVTELEHKGLKVRKVFESISAVAGTLTPAAAPGLAELEQVEKVEYDGEVHAL
jgi:hypothetical protein